MRMGLREANQRFSKAIKAVRAGEEVVLTDRGKPIAVIAPVRARTGYEAAIRRMVASGLLIPAQVRGPMRPCRPIRIKGEPITVTLRRIRDER